MTVLYEDNHLIIVNKNTSEIVQGDKTGDTPLSETVKLWLKKKYDKPGNVFVGVTHRLDRPVSGIVVLAKTSKALARLNEMFRKGEVKKSYWAIVQTVPEKEADEILEVDLKTGRHHQIRCQLAKIGSPIKGDLKYGAKRSNPDGGISLHARHIHFIHPVSKQVVDVTAPVPDDSLWKYFEQAVSSGSTD